MNTNYDLIYSGRTRGIFLLFQTDIPNASLYLPQEDVMPFLKMFNNISNAYDHAYRTPQCSYNFYAYGDNMLSWPNIGNNVILPMNLKNIKIFCLNPNEKHFYKSWARRFPQVIEVLTIKDLDRDILLDGLRLIEDLRFEIGEESIKNLFQQDYNKVHHALTGSFDGPIAIANNDIAMGVQPS